MTQMKRHPELHSLSHDHHHGLVQARRLLAAADRELVERQAAAESFQTAWTEVISPHFALEERLLVPLLRDDADAQRLFDEHIQLRALVGNAAGLDGAALHDLGSKLHDHIRWEERELFPLLERTSTAEELAELGAALRKGQ